MPSSTSSSGSKRSKKTKTTNNAIGDFYAQIVQDKILEELRPIALTYELYFEAFHAIEVSTWGRCRNTKCLRCNPLLKAAQELVNSES